jgi:hypothetical protein
MLACYHLMLPSHPIPSMLQYNPMLPPYDMTACYHPMLSFHVIVPGYHHMLSDHVIIIPYNLLWLSFHVITVVETASILAGLFLKIQSFTLKIKFYFLENNILRVTIRTQERIQVNCVRLCQLGR